MIAYTLRSLAQAVMVMLAVALLAFSMFRFVGDPVANMVGQEASVKERAELAERLGLNDPFPIQFANFVRDMTRGEFGMSYRQGRPVRDLLIEKPGLARPAHANDHVGLARETWEEEIPRSHLRQLPLLEIRNQAVDKLAEARLSFHGG